MSKDTSFIIMSGYFHGPANPESCLQVMTTRVQNSGNRCGKEKEKKKQMLS